MSNALIIKTIDEYCRLKKRQTYSFNCLNCGILVTTQRRTEKARAEKQKLFLCQNCLTKRVCQDRYGCDYPGQSEISKQHQKTTCLEKYGVENPFQAEACKEKSKQTCLEKYGTEYAAQNVDVKNKQKSTLLENYGVDNVFKSEKIKALSKSTCLERYGVEYYTQTDEYKNRCKQTCLEKYGAEYSLQANDVKQKGKEACIQKYGVPFYAQTDEGKQRYKQTCLERYGVENTGILSSNNRRSRYQIDGISLDSSWELIFYMFNKLKGYQVKRCRKFYMYSYNDTIHYYYPDFEVDGQFYEIKGDQFFKADGTMCNPYDHSLDELFEAKHQCGLLNNVIFIRKIEIQEMKKFCISVIGNSFLKDYKR